MRVIIANSIRQERTNTVFVLSYTFAGVASQERVGEGTIMAKKEKRLLCERPIEQGGASNHATRGARPVRSVTVNVTESPLGWLFARGFISQRQYDAGERLRCDWERAQLSPRVTMAWDATPVARGRGGSAIKPDLNGAQIDAKRRFDDAIATAGPGLAAILWRIVCAGEGMREAETALGWPARAGKLVLTFALDRVADYYGVR
jgi:hypothetical protein